MHTSKCYIFDLDGTLADLSHRLHHIQKSPKDWRAFFAYENVYEDGLITHVGWVYGSLRRAGNPTVIVSGRSDECWEATTDWLAKHGVQYDKLYMRTAGDRRPDYQVKYDLLQKLKADGWEPIMAFDDRDQVVQMWRDNGIPCAQVAPGSF